MADRVYVRGIAGLHAAVASDMAKLRKKVHSAATQAAIEAGHAAVAKVPIAFGELRASIHVDATDPRVVGTYADAPHAAAVEVGSRPHWVPLEALVRWVKLRGMQGLDKRGNVRAKAGPGITTPGHSFNVARQFKQAERSGAVDVDEPVRIAKRIQAAIAKHGTAPHWFMRQARPIAMKALDRAIARALKSA